MQLIETLHVKYYWSLTKNLSIQITLCIVMYYSYITIYMQDILRIYFTFYKSLCLYFSIYITCYSLG